MRSNNYYKVNERINLILGSFIYSKPLYNLSETVRKTRSINTILFISIFLILITSCLVPTVMAIPPSVVFTATPLSGTVPLYVQFNDTSANTPIAWNWSFGDGTYSNVQNPNYTFASSGSYTVRLNASNGDGFGNYSRIISVGAGYPISQFTASPTYGTVPLTVYFIDTSIAHGITAWSWNFGDGGTSTLQSPPHAYTTNGVYHVTLTITDSVGVDTSDETIIYISPSPLPLVNFIGTPLSSGSAPLTVYFTDLTQNINSSIAIWNWSFGDGSYAITQNPSHVYTSGGQYSVTLLVTNSSVTNYTTKYGYINVGVPIGNVFVDYTATPISGANPLIVQFNDASVCNPICNNWNWDLDGDGSIDSYSKNPSYTYTYPGIYSPRLIVSNGLDSGVKIKVHYITAGTVYVPTTIPQPTELWKPGYNGSVFNMQGGSTVDMPNSTYLKYWLQNFTTTGNFSIYGFALGMMAPIMHVFGFWIFLIVWGLYLFAVWIRSQDVTLPLIIGILTMGTFGLLFPKETLPVIIIMFVVCGAIIITKLMKE
jgi:PKD repeat protein